MPGKEGVGGIGRRGSGLWALALGLRAPGSGLRAGPDPAAVEAN